MWEINGFCGTLRDCAPACHTILPTSEEDYVFSGKEKGMYFRVDSVDTGDTACEVEKTVCEASVIQYIIFFLSERVYK